MVRFVFATLALLTFSLPGIANAPQSGKEDFRSIQVKDIDGKAHSMGEYAGKALLIVNTASQCGFTPQYQGLEELYNKYKSRGLVVLGFPSNDFGSQEPGTNAEIKKFCEMKFKVSFPLFSKEPVTGEAKQPLYRFLTTHATPSGEVSWNFEKFLVNKQGEIVGRFKSSVSPQAPELDKAIAALLK